MTDFGEYDNILDLRVNENFVVFLTHFFKMITKNITSKLLLFAFVFMI